jgi:hypothetical protein
MEPTEDLVLLVDELIDAHDDTLRLSQDLQLGSRWEAHLCYLRDLRRVGREVLAAAIAGGGAEASPPAYRTSARLRSCHAARRAGHTERLRGDRRCARNGYGDGPA